MVGPIHVVVIILKEGTEGGRVERERTERAREFRGFDSVKLSLTRRERILVARGEGGLARAVSSETEETCFEWHEQF